MVKASILFNVSIEAVLMRKLMLYFKIYVKNAQILWQDPNIWTCPHLNWKHHKMILRICTICSDKSHVGAELQIEHSVLRQTIVLLRNDRKSLNRISTNSQKVSGDHARKWLLARSKRWVMPVVTIFERTAKVSPTFETTIIRRRCRSFHSIVWNRKSRRRVLFTWKVGKFSIMLFSQIHGVLIYV